LGLQRQFSEAENISFTVWKQHHQVVVLQGQFSEAELSSSVPSSRRAADASSAAISRPMVVRTIMQMEAVLRALAEAMAAS